MTFRTSVAWMTDEHRMLQDIGARASSPTRWVPRAAEFREAGLMPPGGLARGRRQRPAVRLHARAEYGGGGGDFGHEAVILLEQARANLSGWGGGLHSAIVAPYILHYGTEEQKQPLAAEDGHGRAHHRDRDDRARHRQRPAGVRTHARGATATTT